MTFKDDAAYDFDKWFDTKAGQYIDAKEKCLIKNALKGVDGKILEVGSGTGRYMEYLQELGYDVTGIEPSVDMIKIAKNKKNIESGIVKGSAENLPFSDNEFEAVLFMTSLEFVEHREIALKEAFRTARKKVVIGFLNSKGITNKRRQKTRHGQYKNAVFMSRKDLLSLLKNIGNEDWKIINKLHYSIYAPVKVAYKYSIIDKFLEFFNLSSGNFAVAEIINIKEN